LLTPLIEESFNVSSALIVSKYLYIHRSLLGKPQSKCVLTYFRMLANMEDELLAKAEASTNYRMLILGLAEEAAERNII
jgi:hypothetical protein